MPFSTGAHNRNPSYRESLVFLAVSLLWLLFNICLFLATAAIAPGGFYYMRHSDSLINLGCVFAIWVAMIGGCRPCRVEDFPGTITVTSITPHDVPVAKEPDDSKIRYMVSIDYELENNGGSVPSKVRRLVSTKVLLTNQTIMEKHVRVGAQYRAFTTYTVAGACQPVDGEMSIPEWGLERFEVDTKTAGPRKSN